MDLPTPRPGFAQARRLLFQAFPSGAALRRSVAHVGLALRDPEEFAARRHRGEVEYESTVWLALIATAILGTTVYGLTMGIGEGLRAVCTKSILLTLSAGLAWAVPLPALYILNSLGGSRLKPSTTLLAALVTTSWGGLAMLASVPINWFFSVAIPDLPFLAQQPHFVRYLIVGVNLLVFTGVGVAMIDVFGRVMQRLEPRREAEPIWYLVLVGLIGAQLFYFFELFRLPEWL
ncbi:MAG: hypothetical protein K8U03_20480 [Planctomycetia bacterium]|nr:hypothetical protein [Planctomycetia bacterium]